MKFEQGSYYHIYNRGVASSDTFFSNDDIYFFLSKFRHYLFLSVETHAYCILKNHFHFLIKPLAGNQIECRTSAILENDFDSHYILPNSKNRDFPTHLLISHWLNSYSTFLNKKYNRSGPVWDGRLKKRIIDSEEYLQKAVCYIHRNPIHHGITTNYSDYPFSSYSQILNNSSSIIDKNSVINIFGSMDNFVAAHGEFKGGDYLDDLPS